MHYSKTTFSRWNISFALRRKTAAFTFCQQLFHTMDNLNKKTQKISKARRLSKYFPETLAVSILQET